MFDCDGLREFVVEALKDKTVAKERVYDSELSLDDDELPLINVFTPDDLEQDGLLIISLEVNALLMVDAGESAGKKIGAFRKEIRTALRRFWQASGEFTASYLGTEFLFDVEAVQPYAAAKLKYQVEVLNEEE